MTYGRIHREAALEAEVFEITKKNDPSGMVRKRSAISALRVGPGQLSASVRDALTSKLWVAEAEYYVAQSWAVIDIAGKKSEAEHVAEIKVQHEKTAPRLKAMFSAHPAAMAVVESNTKLLHTLYVMSQNSARKSAISAAAASHARVAVNETSRKTSLQKAEAIADFIGGNWAEITSARDDSQKLQARLLEASREWQINGDSMRTVVIAIQTGPFVASVLKEKIKLIAILEGW